MLYHHPLKPINRFNDFVEWNEMGGVELPHSLEPKQPLGNLGHPEIAYLFRHGGRARLARNFARRKRKL